MQIILTKDVNKQGKKGSILNVKDGFGMFLINKGDAKLASTSNINKLEKEKKLKEEEEKELIKESNKIKEKIEKITLSFIVKTGNQDRVFGSISPKQITEELKNKGFNIDKKQIKLETPISSLGMHIVSIQLHKSVIANLKIELKK